MIIAAILGLTVFGVYKFYPKAFDKVKDEYNKLTGKATDTPAVIHKNIQPVKKDTVKKTTPVTDSAAKAAAVVAKPDTVKAAVYGADNEPVPQFTTRQGQGCLFK